MITYLFFVRHSESDISIREDRIRPLTQKGIENSKKLLEIFKDIKIDCIYSSPYKRTIDTVKYISAFKNLPVIENENLRERNNGEWVNNIKEYMNQQWNDFDYKLPNGESLKEVQYRNINTIKNIITSHPGKNVIIGTHGTALSVIINYFDSKYDYNEFLKIKDKMPYIIKLKFENDKYIKREALSI